jgi:FtsZ-binding cell division protein ZapB
MLSQETKDMIKGKIEELKMEKASISKEIGMLLTRRDELSIKKDAIQNKIDKFQADLNG